VDAHLVEAVERVAGREVTGGRAASGGYTHNANWVVTFAGGGSAFVKAAVDEQTAAWLRAEERIYSSITGSFLPRLLGRDAKVPLLVLEDLSAATWPPPWSERLVSRVLAALDELHRVAPPPGLPTPDEIDDLRSAWAAVGRDPEPFLELGLCSSGWLERALPALLEAAERAELDGDSLVHLDVRSDNLCLHGDRCVLVDWNQAALGNPLLDLALWLPSLELEGGPPVERLATPAMTDLAAVFAGYLACRAGLPEPPRVPPPGVRPLQAAQLRVALPWAARGLGLPAPDLG
jgi:Phosphotransferase enzyme family